MVFDGAYEMKGCEKGRRKEAIDLLDIKWGILTSLLEGEIARRVSDCWQVDNAAGTGCEWVHFGFVGEST